MSLRRTVTKLALAASLSGCNFISKNIEPPSQETIYASFPPVTYEEKAEIAVRSILRNTSWGERANALHEAVEDEVEIHYVDNIVIGGEESPDVYGYFHPSLSGRNDIQVKDMEAVEFIEYLRNLDNPDLENGLPSPDAWEFHEKIHHYFRERCTSYDSEARLSTEVLAFYIGNSTENVRLIILSNSRYAHLHIFSPSIFDGIIHQIISLYALGLDDKGVITTFAENCGTFDERRGFVGVDNTITELMTTQGITAQEYQEGVNRYLLSREEEKREIADLVDEVMSLGQDN